MFICPGCGEEGQYYAKGLCKVCYNRQWDRANPDKKKARDCGWREKHKDHIAAYNKRYYEEHREESLAYQRQYRQENGEKVAASNRRHYQKHRGIYATNSKRWVKENPERAAAIKARRRAREKRVPDTLTTEQSERLLTIGQAMYPGEKLHLDHIVPISRGGGTTRANIHFIPATVNHRKGNKLPQETYRQERLGA